MNKIAKFTQVLNASTTVVDIIFILTYLTLLLSGKLYFDVLNLVVISVITLFIIYNEISKFFNFYKNVQWLKIIDAASHYNNADYFKGE